MRISTSQIYQSGARSLMDGQTSLYKIQNQLSTGKRFLSAQDDPVAAAQVVLTNQSLAVNSQFADNQSNASSQLAYEEGQLESVVESVQYIMERVVAGGNGSYSDSDRESIAADLQSQFDLLLGLANSKDANGYYLFSGYKSDTKPFELQADGSVTYAGDDGQRLLQVGPSRQIAVNDSGETIFDNGQSVFGTLQNLITAFSTDISGDATATAAFNSTYETELENLHGILDNVLSVQASIGSRMNELDSLANLSSTLDLQYQERLSNLQDIDYAETISRFIQQQTQLEASQSSYAKITGLSLFNYL